MATDPNSSYYSYISYSPGGFGTLGRSFDFSAWASAQPAPAQPTFSYVPSTSQTNTTIINYYGSTETASVATGLDSNALASSLYGKPIPIVVIGQARIGCRIIEGPILSSDNSSVSMIVAAARPVNESGQRHLVEISLNGTPVWRDSDGFIVAPAFVFRFHPGTFDQSPDDLSVNTYGDRAIAYRPLITLAIENLPMATFSGKIPFVSLLVAETDLGSDPADGVTLSESLALLAEYAGYTPLEYSIEGVTGRCNAQIIASEMTFMDYLQSMRKLYPSWNILTDSKLRIVEKGTSSIDEIIDKTKVTANGRSPISFSHTDPMTVPREKNYTFIDIDRDYEPNTVTCRQEREPVSSTASAQSEDNSLPLVTTGEEAIAQVYFAAFSEEIARQKGRFTVKAETFGIEPGDVIAYDVKRPRTHHVTGVSRNMAWTADVSSEGFLACTVTPTFPTPPPPPDTRFWTMFISSSNSTRVAMAELRFHSSIGGSNILTGGTAWASSYIGLDSVTYAASNVLDNNVATQWISYYEMISGDWWKYDFGSGHTASVVQAVITYADYQWPTGPGLAQGPQSFWFAHSAGFDGPFKATWGVTGQTTWAEEETRTFANPGLNPSSAHAYWAIVMMTNFGTNAYNLGGIEMRATAGGADQCSGGTPIGDDWTDIGNLFDGDPSTTATKGGGNAWVGYYFASPVNVTEIAITNGGSIYAAPQDFTIMCSDDGIHWTASWTPQTLGWAIGETKVFTKP